MKVDERELDRIEAIMLSMTPEERRRPELIKGKRRLRIAKGSGTSVQQVRNMGPLGNMMKMIPGMGKAMQGMGQVDERELDRIEAIIKSMTPYERAHPDEINGSRRKRIATGSGTTVQAVNQLLKQFGQMKKMMRQLQSGRMPNIQQLAGGR